MSLVGFEPTVSAGERPQTYALGRAATGTDQVTFIMVIAVALRPDPSKVCDSVTWVVPIVQFNKHNMSTEHNMANLLVPMSRNCSSSFLRQHMVNQSFFMFYRVP